MKFSAASDGSCALLGARAALRCTPSQNWSAHVATRCNRYGRLNKLERAHELIADGSAAADDDGGRWHDALRTLKHELLCTASPSATPSVSPTAIGAESVPAATSRPRDANTQRAAAAVVEHRPARSEQPAAAAAPAAKPSDKSAWNAKGTVRTRATMRTHARNHTHTGGTGTTTHRAHPHGLAAAFLARDRQRCFRAVESAAPRQAHGRTSAREEPVRFTSTEGALLEPASSGFTCIRCMRNFRSVFRGKVLSTACDPRAGTWEETDLSNWAVSNLARRLEKLVRTRAQTHAHALQHTCARTHRCGGTRMPRPQQVRWIRF
jgi:hypothetical protein